MKRLYSFLILRLASVVIVILLILTVEFIVLRIMGGQDILVPKAGSPWISTRIMDHWSTNEPIAVQCLVFLKNMLTLDFGTSSGVYHGGIT